MLRDPHRCLCTSPSTSGHDGCPRLSCILDTPFFFNTSPLVHFGYTVECFPLFAST